MVFLQDFATVEVEQDVVFSGQQRTVFQDGDRTIALVC